MHTPRLSSSLLVALLAAAAALAGCGGGAGGSATTTAGGSAAALRDPTATADTIVAAVATPSYAADSGELTAFNRLNADRARCGFGLLAQNSALDNAAASHMAYMATNGFGHSETEGLAGFTGADPAARWLAVGYDYAAGGEYLAGGTVSPARQMAILMAVPYHAVVVTGGFRDVGLSWGAKGLDVELGVATGAAYQSAPGVRTYPCEGSTDVAFGLANELPSPFPNEASPSWGATISVVGRSVSVKTVAITGPAGSVAIKAIYGLGQTPDPQNECVNDRTCIIPQVLQPNTTYQVQITGTQGGSGFARSFSFTTTRS